MLQIIREDRVTFPVTESTPIATGDILGDDAVISRNCDSFINRLPVTDLTRNAIEEAISWNDDPDITTFPDTDSIRTTSLVELIAEKDESVMLISPRKPGYQRKNRVQYIVSGSTAFLIQGISRTK